MRSQLVTRASRAALVLSVFCVAGSAYGGIIGSVAERAVEHVASRVQLQLEAAPQVALPKPGSFDACRDVFPQARPVRTDLMPPAWRATPLCFKTFAVVYSPLSKTPLLVAERLTRAGLSDALDESRSNEFYPDPRLPAGSRAELDDFRGSGLDRGHLSPAANQPDQNAMVQSFSLSNMVPQDPHHNRKVWSKAESDVRKFARRAAGNVFVFSGPMFRGSVRTIGRGHVWVPTHLFKLVYDESTQRAWAYIQENSASAQMDAPVDYATFVRETGWDVLAGLAVAPR